MTWNDEFLIITCLPSSSWRESDEKFRINPRAWRVRLAQNSISTARSIVQLYLCKNGNAASDNRKSMPLEQMTMSGAIMAMNQWQWLTWFSRRRHFLPPLSLLLPQLSSLTAADLLTTSPLRITWTLPAFDVLFTVRQPSECSCWYGCYIFAGSLLLIDWVHHKWETTPFFFPLNPSTLHTHTHPLTHTHTVISLARNSNSNWMLNKAACWIIEDLRPGRILISIQALWT